MIIEILLNVAQIGYEQQRALLGHIFKLVLSHEVLCRTNIFRHKIFETQIFYDEKYFCDAMHLKLWAPIYKRSYDYVTIILC